MNSQSIHKKRVSNPKGKVHLGLCCINNSLRKYKPEGSRKSVEVFCSRSTPRRTFTVERAKEMALANIADITKLVDWNIQNNIHHLRLSSDMFPHFTDRETEPYTMDFAVDSLRKAGDYCNRRNHRITMHPGQFNQVGAKSSDVFEHTVNDLSMHADILDYMDIDSTGILCVHGGGVYGDKEASTRRWIEQFSDLPRKVRDRLAIENDEKCYSVRDCLTIAQECKIPMIYDTHHHTCYHCHYNKEDKEEDIEDMMDEIVDTWQGLPPVFHISEQAPDKNVGAHSDFIEVIPQHLLDVPEIYNTSISIEVEAKAKEAAILKLMKKYKEIF